MIFDFNKWRESISVLMVTDLNYFLLQNVHVWGFVQFFFFLLLFSLQIVKAGSIQFITNSMLPVGHDLEFAKQSTQDI